MLQRTSIAVGRIGCYFSGLDNEGGKIIIAGTILFLGSAYAEPPPTLFHATDIVQDISDTTTIRQRFVDVETGLLSTIFNEFKKKRRVRPTHQCHLR